MKYGLHIRDPCPPSGSGGEVCDKQRKDHGGVRLLALVESRLKNRVNACPVSITSKNPA